MPSRTTETDAKNPEARLVVRTTKDRKALLQDAAAVSRCTPSEFVRASAQKAASSVIRQRETIFLSRSEQVALVTALLKPRAPDARLREAAEKCRRQPGM